MRIGSVLLVFNDAARLSQAAPEIGIGPNESRHFDLNKFFQIRKYVGTAIPTG